MAPYVASPDVLFMDTKASSPSVSVSSEPTNGTLVMPQWRYGNPRDIRLWNTNMVVWNSDKFTPTEQFPGNKIPKPTFCPSMLVFSNPISNIPNSSAQSSPIFTDKCYNVQTKSTPFFPRIDVKLNVPHAQCGNQNPFTALYPPTLQGSYLPTPEPSTKYSTSHSFGKPNSSGAVWSAKSKKSIDLSGKEISEAENRTSKETKKKKYIVRSLRKKLHQKNKSLHKTELCTHWTLTSTCTFRGKCYFAHGLDELISRVRQGNFKTRPCVEYAVAGKRCRYGLRCHYCHPGEAVRCAVDEPYIDSDYNTALKKKYGDNKYPYGIYL